MREYNLIKDYILVKIRRKHSRLIVELIKFPWDDCLSRER